MTNVQIEWSTTMIIEIVAPLFISHKNKIYENKTHTETRLVRSKMRSKIDT